MADQKSNDSSLLKLHIDGILVPTTSGSTILEAAESSGIQIPKLCHHPLVKPRVACRLCLVRVNGADNFLPACATLAQNGMVIITQDQELREIRRVLLELQLGSHPHDCARCAKNFGCELQKQVFLGKAWKKNLAPTPRSERSIDGEGPIIRDHDKCIQCGLCIAGCSDIQGVINLSYQNRGADSVVGPAFQTQMTESDCTYCGQCVALCPTAALRPADNSERLRKALEAKDNNSVALLARSVAKSIAISFGIDPDKNTFPQVAAALKRLGFKRVLPIDYGLPLYLKELSIQLQERLKSPDSRLPLIISCSSAVVSYIKKFHPKYCQNLIGETSLMDFACLSVKNSLEETHNPFLVGILPCIAHKRECDLIQEGKLSGSTPDLVVNAAEIVGLLNENGIDYLSISREQINPSNKIEENTFGLYESLGGMKGCFASYLDRGEMVGSCPSNQDKQVPIHGAYPFFYQDSFQFKGKEIKCLSVSTLKEAGRILEEIEDGRISCQILEIHACLGGCYERALSSIQRPSLGFDPSSQLAFKKHQKFLKNRTPSLKKHLVPTPKKGGWQIDSVLQGSIGDFLKKHQQSSLPLESGLIEALQILQKQDGFLVHENLVALSKALNLSLAEVAGVATFYHNFTFSPKGKYEIIVCSGTACYSKGSKEVLTAVEKAIRKRPSGLFSVVSSQCLGTCGLAPVLKIGEKVYGSVTPERVEEILAMYN